jgi:hypothetical protein
MKILYRIERFYLAPLMIFFVTVGDADCVGQDNHKLAVLKKCESLFGATIDAKANLFQIDSQFILQPEFSTDDELIALHVKPHCFFKEIHPEWTKASCWPLISETEYQNLLLKLDTISPRGKLVWVSRILITTNQTSDPLSQYENVYVKSGLVTGSKNYRFFDFYPVHEVSGEIIRKMKSDDESDGVLYQVMAGRLVGSLVYFVKSDEFEKLHEGSTQKFRGIGPMDGPFFRVLSPPERLPDRLR